MPVNPNPEGGEGSLFRLTLNRVAFSEGRQMKIGDLAARAALNASAIRYYEKMALLTAPQRVGGQRRYPSEALDRALLIRVAGDMGFTLGEIKLFLNGLHDNTPVGPRWKKLAANKIAEVYQNIGTSLKLKIHISC